MRLWGTGTCRNCPPVYHCPQRMIRSLTNIRNEGEGVTPLLFLLLLLALAGFERGRSSVLLVKVGLCPFDVTRSYGERRMPSISTRLI